MPVRQTQRSTPPSHSPSPIGVDESELWSMADALRGSMDAAECKHVVLGLIFLVEMLEPWVALPGQLFYSTQIPACLWFLTRDRAGRRLRDRRGEVLFIDARELGSMVDRTHRELTANDIAQIADTCHRWRGEADGYEDLPGCCRSAPLEEIRRHDHVLTRGRYVGAPPAYDDGEPFADKMMRLVAELHEQQAQGARLDTAIAANLESLGLAKERA